MLKYVFYPILKDWGKSKVWANNRNLRQKILICLNNKNYPQKLTNFLKNLQIFSKIEIFAKKIERPA